jgi:hypothetical protein
MPVVDWDGSAREVSDGDRGFLQWLEIIGHVTRMMPALVIFPIHDGIQWASEIPKLCDYEECGGPVSLVVLYPGPDEVSVAFVCADHAGLMVAQTPDSLQRRA